MKTTSPPFKMVNAGRPTTRSRHIDIQHFAIQDWKQAGDLELIHIPGIINPADCLTKPVAWILHSRHTGRLMGHYVEPIFLWLNSFLHRLILVSCLCLFLTSCL
jgi:hypothetical protein